MGFVVNRFEVFLVNLDPTIGSEIQKTRPILIISPNEMNNYSARVIVAPITTKGHAYPSQVACHFEWRDGQIVLDQIRRVDKLRLVKKLGKIDISTQKEVLAVLMALFTE